MSLHFVSGIKPKFDVPMEFGDHGEKIIAVKLTVDDLSFINQHLGRVAESTKEDGNKLSAIDKILSKIWLAAKGKL